MVHSGQVMLDRSTYMVVDCAKCAFIHLVDRNFMPYEPVQFYNFYKSCFYEEAKPNYIDDVTQDNYWWEMHFKNRINFVDNLSERNNLKRTSRWLDIGSGAGIFLNAAKLLNKYSVGIEPSKTAYSFSQRSGNVVINDYFDEYSSKKLIKAFGKFDAIHFSEVLEHVPNPVTFLANVKEVLNPNGYVVIVVPNEFNLLQRLANHFVRNKYWFISPPDHLNYFTPNSLQQLLNRCGFEVLHKSSTFPIEIFLLLGMNYIDKPVLGKRSHQLRKSLEIQFNKIMGYRWLFRIYGLTLRLGIGREILFVCKVAPE